MSDTRLLPRNQLDEFGLVMDFADYVSDTFPLQTDIGELNSDHLFFVLYNVTDVVREILDNKFRKLAEKDPRLLFNMYVKHPGDGVDICGARVRFPRPHLRTNRTLPVYRNLDKHGFYIPAAGIHCPRDPAKFRDVAEATYRLEFLVQHVVSYQSEKRDTSSRSRLTAGLKTGDKSCVPKKKKPSISLRW